MKYSCSSHAVVSRGFQWHLMFFWFRAFFLLQFWLSVPKQMTAWKPWLWNTNCMIEGMLDSAHHSFLWKKFQTTFRTTITDNKSYMRSGSGQSMMTVCSVLYGFRRPNSKNSVDPIDTNSVCSVVMATFSMFMMPSLLLCARNISIVRRSRMRSSFSRCIDYNRRHHILHRTTKQLPVCQQIKCFCISMEDFYLVHAHPLYCTTVRSLYHVIYIKLS